MAKWLRPTVDTKFHIDLDWWQKQKRDIRIYLNQSLCGECRQAYADIKDLGEVDDIDVETGEVTRQDALWSTLRSCCSTKPTFITPSTPIIDSIFLTFVANGNQPLSPEELHKRLDRRPAETILRMLTGGQVYLGIRPAGG
jgi:hypothetical protein